MKILIFSTAGCQHCNKAKALFAGKDAGFAEINLTDYPELREGMIKLTQRATVPQIFFGDTHIGGADELIQLAATDELDIALANAQAGPGATLPELIPPTYPPKPSPTALPLKPNPICIGNACIPYNNFVASVLTKVQIERRRRSASPHRQCFVASQFVDYLMQEYNLDSREAAVEVGETLRIAGVFHIVTSTGTFLDDDHLYRLQCCATPASLNTWRLWGDDRVDDPLVTVAVCHNMLLELEAKHTDPAVGKVNLVAVKNDPAYLKFHAATCEFQKVDLALLNLKARLAFCCNLYNLMIRHAFIAYGIPESGMQRNTFFGGVGYNIGGHQYSFNDLEHGVLRGNKVPSFHISRQLPKGDPRLSAVFAEPDCRIHFALNCGAVSCPAISLYTAEGIDTELDVAAAGFCESSDGIAVDEATKTLWLSKLLSWYGADFGCNNREIATSLCKWLRGNTRKVLQTWLNEGGEAAAAKGKVSFKIKYFKYDWSNNASQYIQFKGTGKGGGCEIA